MIRKPQTTLTRLAADWLREASDLERRIARDAITPEERKLLGMQARTRRACAEQLSRTLLQEGLRG